MENAMGFVIVGSWKVSRNCESEGPRFRRHGQVLLSGSQPQA